MSTQLLDPQVPQVAPDEITDEVAAASVTLTATGVQFDRSTRQRLLVAEAVADTLESLSDERAWDRLDSAIQAHLLAQARRLQDHVASLGSQRAVRSVEETALRLKRLERRLAIVAEDLEPPKEGKRSPAGLFLGDFTEAEAMPGAAPGDKKKAKAKPEAKTARAGKALKDGVTRFRGRAERMATKAMHRRLTAYVMAGVLIAGGAVAWNAKESFTEGQKIQRPPMSGFRMNEYLKELQVFLPATTTVLRDRDIRIVVTKEWLLRSEARRRQDAEGAHVWLSNRNIPSMMLTWDDGTPLVRFSGESATWFDMSKPKQVLPGAPTTAVDMGP